MCNPEDFIRDQLPMSVWPAIPTVLRTAYRSVDELIKDNPILQVESAEDNRGRFISYAVDFGLKRAVESGALQCDFRWTSFARPTGRYLELRFTHSTASVSQVSEAKTQPRNVVFRENARLNNQKVFDFPEFQDAQRVVGMPHFLIVHGHKSLNFAHLGVPSATSKTEYAWRSSNLMKLPHEIETDLPAAEDTEVDFDDLNLIKEDIERWQRDHDSEH